MKKLIIFKLLLSSFLCFSSDLESAFNGVYEKGIWGKDESGFGTSGSGSTAESCIPYVEFVNDFIQKNDIKTILDVGCGDGIVLSYFALNDSISYTGIDLVEKILEKNRIKFPQHTFLKKNIVNDEIPFVDLILCKDVLQHLSNDKIILALKNISNHCRYALLTNDISRTKNQDIIDGDYRPINLKVYPFKQRGKEVFRYTCPSGELKSIFFIKGTSQSNNL